MGTSIRMRKLSCVLYIESYQSIGSSLVTNDTDSYNNDYDEDRRKDYSDDNSLILHFLLQFLFL